MSADRRADLARLLVLAGIVRGWNVLVTFTAKGDSAGLIAMARALAEGRWGRFLGEGQHPLSPALVALAHGLVEDWILAGQLVGWLATTATVGFVYLWVAEVADRRAAIGSGVLAALHPELSRFAGSVLTEGPYFLFYAVALWLGSRAMATRRWPDAMGSGIAAGACYLCRPEGMVLVALATLGVVLARVEGEARWRGPVLGGLALLGFGLTASPYVALVSWQRGYPALTTKKGGELFSSWRFKEAEPIAPVPEPALAEGAVRGRVEDLLARLRSGPTAGGLETGGVDPHGPDAPNAFLQTVEQTYYERGSREVGDESVVLGFLEAYHPLLVVLLLVGLPGGREGVRRSGWWAGGLVLAFGGLLAWNNWTQHYVSSRHALSMGLPCLAWSGVGLVRLGEWVRRALGRIGRRGGLLLPALVATAILLPQTLKPQGAKSLDRLAIGRNLRDRGALGRVVMTSDGKVSFYAEAEYLPVTQWGGYRALLADLVRYDVPFVVLDEGELFRIEELVEAGWLEPIEPEAGTDWARGSKLRVFGVRLPE